MWVIPCQEYDRVSVDKIHTAVFLLSIDFTKQAHNFVDSHQSTTSPWKWSLQISSVKRCCEARPIQFWSLFMKLQNPNFAALEMVCWGWKEWWTTLKASTWILFMSIIATHMVTRRLRKQTSCNDSISLDDNDMSLHDEKVAWMEPSGVHEHLEWWIVEVRGGVMDDQSCSLCAEDVL